MAVKYLVPLLTIIVTASLAFSLQAHAPAWRDFLGWFGLVGLIIGGLQLLTGLILLILPKKMLAQVFLITGLSLLLIGGAVCTLAIGLG